MRDMEFLPAWYPQTRKRRRMVVLQGWLTLLLVAGMGTHLVLSDRNIKTQDKTLSTLRAQFDQTNAQLVEMDKQDIMRQQLRQQEQIVTRLGFHVQACKAVETLDTLMPKQMSLTGVQLENEEKASISAIQQAKNGDVALDRRLKVKIQGVCPTEYDLATFMTELQKVSFFEQINVTYAREKSENGHVMREFEVSFLLSLNGAGS
jgi:Tfp pilus assembly protein PilN